MNKMTIKQAAAAVLALLTLLLAGCASTGDGSTTELPTEGGEVTNRSPFVMHLEKNGEMVAYGHVAYNEERFSELVVATGTFYYMRNLALDPEVAGQEFGPANWADYGLAPEDDPAWFEITRLSGGDPIRVYVGDAAITGNGYYVRVAGRDNAVYVSNSNMVGETALRDLPSFVDPALTVPLVSPCRYRLVHCIPWS